MTTTATPAPTSGLEPRSFHLRVYGCQMNFYDGELIRASFIRRGWTEADSPERAQAVLFHTCSVRENAEERVHGLLGDLRRRKRSDPGVVVGVIGCMADREGEELFAREPHVDVVCGSRHFPSLPDFVERVIGGEERVLALGNSEERVDEVVRDLGGRAAGHSAHVAVMRGCDLNCTYCVVPRVRGRAESRPAREILDEIRRLVDDGVTEVQLLGQTIDAWGRDLPPEERDGLAGLMDAVEAIDGLERIRLITLHPSYVTPALTGALARSRKFLRLLPIPMQSGSDQVLRAMKRGYNAEMYRRRVALLRDAMPDLELVSDWIVGFPGETEDDFAATERAMEEHGFLQSFVFQYSPRPGTSAFERLPDDVPAATKKERNHRLLALQHAIARGRTPRMVGSESAMMLEERRDDQWFGRIHNGHAALLSHREGWRAGLSRLVALEAWNGRELLARELTPEAPIPPARLSATPPVIALALTPAIPAVPASGFAV
ncbi:MAG: MiaB/RimO family radical SAM methylthiotransferase [Planctomycetota bacterium]|nr:MiaB/RimO family radical SAM methylthiotransferase [Planctomycetota bacterium]